MKRPATSLCRRPGKKTACGAVCPRCGNNFRPQGRSAEGRRSCRAKAARTRAQKQPRAGGLGDLHPMGEWREIERVWCREASHWAPAGAEGIPGHKKQPPAGTGDCVQTAPMGERRAIRVSGAGKHYTGRPPGQRAYPAQKQPPAGAGGCLDAGYGCYLPRAIRVIWMHRVGSTARPRIMPS